MANEKRSRKELTPDQVLRVRAKMKELLARPPYDRRSDSKRAGEGGNRTLLAKHLEISAPAVSQYLRKQDMGRATAEAVAHLSGMTYEELVGVAPDVAPPKKDPFPGLTACLKYHSPDHWPASAVAAAHAGVYSDDVPPPEWYRRLDHISNIHANVQKKAAAVDRPRKRKP